MTPSLVPRRSALLFVLCCISVGCPNASHRVAPTNSSPAAESGESLNHLIGKSSLEVTRLLGEPDNMEEKGVPSPAYESEEQWNRWLEAERAEASTWYIYSARKLRFAFNFEGTLLSIEEGYEEPQ